MELDTLYFEKIVSPRDASSACHKDVYKCKTSSLILSSTFRNQEKDLAVLSVFGADGARDHAAIWEYKTELSPFQAVFDQEDREIDIVVTNLDKEGELIFYLMWDLDKRSFNEVNCIPPGKSVRVRYNRNTKTSLKLSSHKDMTVAQNAALAGSNIHLSQGSRLTYLLIPTLRSTDLYGMGAENLKWKCSDTVVVEDDSHLDCVDGQEVFDVMDDDWRDSGTDSFDCVSDHADSVYAADSASKKKIIDNANVASVVRGNRRYEKENTKQMKVIPCTEWKIETHISMCINTNVVFLNIPAESYLEERQETQETQRIFKEESCVCCLTSKPTALFIPCGHACVCYQCYNLWGNTPQRNRCPVCRQRVRAIDPLPPNINK